MKPKILIGLPTMSSVHVHLMLLIVKWIADARAGGEYNLSIYPTVSVQPVDNARNEIVREFLASDCTHLLFIDSDTVPPIDAITKLLALNKPIATGVTPIVEFNEETDEFYRKWNVVDQNDTHVQPNTGIVKAKGAGSSCILIRREVFEAMEAPWYRFHYTKNDKQEDVIVSEDIFFTIMALGKGFETWADTSVICKHAKQTMW